MATIQDQSTYNHDGTTVGDPDAVAGYFGKGIDLDGATQYITTPDSADLQVTTMTIMAWVYRRRNANTEVIYAYRDNAEGVILRFNNTGEIYFYLRNSASGAWSTLVGESALAPLNTWTHIAVTFDATTTDAKMYINGRLEVEGTGLDIPTYTSESTCSVGASSTDNGVSYVNYLDGILDEIYVYSKAFTQCEINNYLFGNITEHTLESKIRSLCPVHYWQLDELSGTEAIDETSVNESLTYQADASTMLDTASQFDGRGTSKDMTVAQIIDPAEPSFPEDWTENLYSTPSQYGYNTEASTGGAGTVWNRYTVGDRFQDVYGENNPFRHRCLAHGFGSNTRLDQGVVASKILRASSKGGKFVFAYTRTYSGGAPYMNINSSTHVYNVVLNSSDVRTIGLQSNARSYIGNVYTPEGSATFNAVWNVGSTTYFFLDLDNDLITVNTNSNTLLPSESITGVLSGWMNVCCATAGDNNGGGDTDFNPDLTGITLPSGTTINDWVGWNDWTEWQTDYEFFPLVNNSSAYSVESLGGSLTLQQGSFNGGIVFTDRLVSPDFVVPTTDNYAVVVQQTSDVFNDDPLTVDIRINNVDQSQTFIVSNEAFGSANYEGGTIGSRSYSLTQGDTVNVVVKALNQVGKQHCCGNIYFVRSK